MSYYLPDDATATSVANARARERNYRLSSIVVTQIGIGYRYGCALEQPAGANFTFLPLLGHNAPSVAYSRGRLGVGVGQFFIDLGDIMM